MALKWGLDLIEQGENLGISSNPDCLFSFELENLKTGYTRVKPVDFTTDAGDLNHRLGGIMRHVKDPKDLKMSPSLTAKIGGVLHAVDSLVEIVVPSQRYTRCLGK